MLRVTMRNLLARKLRLVLSGFAIVLGVAFVAGSFIFTDATKSTFEGIINGTTADVQVCPKNACNFNSAEDTRTIPASVLGKLARLPGAASAHGSNNVQGVYVIGSDHKVVGGSGAPGLAVTYSTAKAITGSRILTLTDGKLPVGTHQIALDETTAQKGNYQIGDQVALETPGAEPSMTATLTGLVRFGDGQSLAGATLTVFDQRAMQQLFFGGRDVYSTISLTARPGVSQSELRDQAQRVLPAGIQAQTGAAAAAESQKGVNKVLGYLNTLLLVFAGIALVVGIFLIINTFSMLVAQRSRELALLRAMGASKRQVTRSVLMESFVVGLIGSTVGLGAGYLLAIGLKALFGVIGLDIGGGSMPVEGRTVIVSYVVGLAVTMLAAYLPARRASKVSPVEAMRDDVALNETSLRRMVLVGGILIVAGIVAIGAGWVASGNGGLSAIGAGALGVLVGVSLLSPVIGRPVISLMGLLYRTLYGGVGRLATANSLRNPRRTAATASALMIGLALVATMTIFGESTKASTEKAIQQTVTAPLIVSNSTQNPFSPTIASRIRKIDGVAAVAELRTAQGKIDGSDASLGAAQMSAVAATLNVRMAAGSFDDLMGNTVYMDAGQASTHHYKVGQTVSLTLQGGTQKLIVGGMFAANSMPVQYLVAPQTLIRGGIKPMDSYLFISKRSSADLATVSTDIDNVLKGLPTVTLQT
ncbi:MAG: ABC transporter permease [Nocardioidaceae bacterium]